MVLFGKSYDIEKLTQAQRKSFTCIADLLMCYKQLDELTDKFCDSVTNCSGCPLKDDRECPRAFTNELVEYLSKVYKKLSEKKFTLSVSDEGGICLEENNEEMGNSRNAG